MDRRSVRRASRILAITVMAVAAVPLSGSAASAGAPPGIGAVHPATAKAALDRAARSAEDAVTAWYVDAGSKAVTIEATDAAAGRRFADRAAVGGAVQVKVVAQRPRPLVDESVGGDPIYNGNNRCSVGFNAILAGAEYVITAGHCTTLPGSWSNATGYWIGPNGFTAFPDDDYGLIRSNNPYHQLRVTGKVRGSVPVSGSAEAAIGASVCRSGSTTGYRCGNIQAKNVTVNYGGGQVVNGLTQTSACAEPGDSGGSYVSGDQAQGILSGGSGNCTIGGITYYQPLNEILTRFSMTLITGP